MGLNDGILVVVSVLEGRRFPKRPRHKIIVETKFDGETLTTDPIDHVETPEFTTELAWELNKKSLHQHRLQRTPIKIQCYALDTLTSQKEPVGYVILDLRTAQQKPARAQWHSLLSTKYQRLKPEVKLMLSLEDDSQSKPTESQASAGRQQQGQQGDDRREPRPTSERRPESDAIHLFLNEEQGYYEIGPQLEDNNIFVLSVTIGLASNLAKLIPSTFTLSDPNLGGGFYFYYSLLSNDVTNEVFQDLLQPNFPAERASVRISSNLEVLKAFFTQHPGLENASVNSLAWSIIGHSFLPSLGRKRLFVFLLTNAQLDLTKRKMLLNGSANVKHSEAMSDEIITAMSTASGIHLCSGDQSLGRAVVSFQGLLDDQQTLVIPAVIEALFPLLAPGRSGQSSGVVDDSEPAVGVSVSLRFEQQDDASASSPILAGGGGGISIADNMPYGGKSAPKQVSGSPPRGKPRESRKEPETEMAGEHPDGTPPRPRSSTPQRGQDKQGPGSGITAGTHKDSPPKKTKMTGQAPQPQIPAPDPSSVPSLGARLPLDPSAHHFCFSVDLHSIANLDVTSPVNCFLRYTYPFFGSSAPVMTSPPVQVQRGMEVLLPKSFCAFDFAASPRLLQETLTRVPLIIEVWHKDNMAGNVLIGVSSASLATVLAADKVQVLSQAKEVTGYRQIYSERLLIFTTETPGRKIGELHVVLGLEDLGPVNLQRLMGANEVSWKDGRYSLSSSPESSQTSSAIPLAEPQRVPPAQPSPPPVTDPRDTAAYKAALELELWKEQQEELFQAQMQQRESTHMKTLAEEWKRRDKERELMVKKKLEEYSRLEDKLKQSIADLERREKQLSASETQVMHMKDELEREHERKMTEMREAARRMKDDCLHQVEMERMKVKDLEQQKQRLVEQVYEAEKRFQAKENEFMAYKEQQLTKPEVKLESEINLLKMEKAELERKLETANKSKIHYKQQWGRALRELARLKQQEQTAARARLKKQEQELEHMRLRYLAAEEKEVVKSEKEALEEIKVELSRLKQQEEAKARLNPEPTESQVKTSAANSSLRRNVRHSAGLSSVHEDDEEDIDSRIAKLIEERDTLLHTGVYTTDDRIIVELDRQIRDAIASKGS